jgi:4-amino-4-deoxy-L-arabinose transferase-like glycosyltransferase
MERRTLKYVLLLALALRGGVLACAWGSPQRLLAPDSPGYIELSNSLADGAFAAGGEPELVRTPGYPMFLLLGVPFGERWWQAVAIAQVLLDVLLVYVTCVLATMLCGPRAGLWAALWQAVAPVAIASSARVLSDGLFAFLLTLAVLLLAHHLRDGALWSLAAGAVVTAVSCYVRPTGLASAAVLIAVLAARAAGAAVTRAHLKRRAAEALLAAAIVALGVAPWVIRNGMAAGYWRFSGISAYNMLGYEAAAVDAARHGVGIDEARESLLASLPPAMSRAQHLRDQQQLAEEVIGRHPLLWARLHATGSLATFLPGIGDVLELCGRPGGRGALAALHDSGIRAALREYFGGEPWAIAVAAPAALLLAIKYALAMVAAVRARWRGDWALWLVLFTVAVLAMLGGPASTPRFRVPIEPLLSVAAGAAVAGWRRKRLPTA